MQSRDTQEHGLVRCHFAADRKECGIDTMEDHIHFLRGNPIETEYVVSRRMRDRNEPCCPMSRPVQQHPPERQIEPSEKLWMPFVLQVVENGYCRARAQERSRESRIKQNVEPKFPNRCGERGLLSEYAAGPKRRMDVQPFFHEVRL